MTLPSTYECPAPDCEGGTVMVDPPDHSHGARRYSTDCEVCRGIGAFDEWEQYEAALEQVNTRG